jgi:hypothetical protein
MIHKNVKFFIVLFLLYFSSGFGSINSFIESNFCKKWNCMDQNRETIDTSAYKASASNTLFIFNLQRMSNVRIFVQKFDNGDQSAYIIMQRKMDFRTTNLQYITDFIHSVVAPQVSYDVQKNCNRQPTKPIKLASSEPYAVLGSVKLVRQNGVVLQMQCKMNWKNQDNLKDPNYPIFSFSINALPR